MNLLQETENTLKTFGFTSDDVLWVGGNTFHFTWNDFASVAKNTPLLQGDQVPFDLVIVGESWWMEREHIEQYGNQQWIFRTRPTKPSSYRVPKVLSGLSMWDSLEDICWEAEND